MGIILLGYRGSGKTSVGRRIAERLSLEFADTDELVVAAAGKSIKAIFEQNGEAHFRDLEAEAVRNVCGRAGAVVALGGGVILREENRNALLASPHRRIYLRCDPAELHKRIHADPLTAANRPSLTHLGGGIDEIRSLLEKRDLLYRAVMTEELDVTALSVEQVVERLTS